MTKDEAMINMLKSSTNFIDAYKNRLGKSGIEYRDADNIYSDCRSDFNKAFQDAKEVGASIWYPIIFCGYIIDEFYHDSIIELEVMTPCTLKW